MGRFVLGFVLGVVAGVVLTVVFFVAVATQDGLSLVSTIYAPEEVQVGEPFALRIVAYNPHPEEVQLHSIDIDESFIGAFEVLAIEPRPTDSTRVPFLDQKSWFFERDVGPGDSLEVTFTLSPLQVGVPVGNVEICNTAVDCTPQSPRLEVIGRSP
ncbi:MAG: hypothetical protein JSW46_09070 [Gemmatimonadota bacterium]|nr:MAG: hypothetical protein JSW46_09070 [Gemmatimonadota bacterium]